jgi:hypothetical protein
MGKTNDGQDGARPTLNGRPRLGLRKPAAEGVNILPLLALLLGHGSEEPAAPDKVKGDTSDTTATFNRMKVVLRDR